MSEDLKPGDEIWVKTIALAVDHFGDVEFASMKCVRSQNNYVRGSDVRKYLGSETAEFDAKIAEAAEDHVDQLIWEHENETCLERRAVPWGPTSRALREAVEGKRKALTPPSLEDKIRDAVENWLKDGKSSADYLIPGLVALVKEHKS